MEHKTQIENYNHLAIPPKLMSEIRHTNLKTCMPCKSLSNKVIIKPSTTAQGKEENGVRKFRRN